ncbi:MAG: hypothetical protein DRQ58_11540 [Gammaproteobacteria bacterium]|nr:MAG: hypothetical protein DRQ58_11540 [Gammaproteobacteria bacterium]
MKKHDRENAQMTDNERDLLLIAKDLLEICRYKCAPTDEVFRADGITNEQVIVVAKRTIKRIETANQPSPVPSPEPSGHLTRFNTGLGVGSRSNAEIRRRNGGVKHQFEDDIGGCSANYQ